MACGGKKNILRKYNLKVESDLWQSQIVIWGVRFTAIDLRARGGPLSDQGLDGIDREGLV